MAPAHTVVAGESYWAIAQSVLGADATPADVLAKTEQLIELNSARLDYADPQMLHPGDVVYLDARVAVPAHKHVAMPKVTEVTETAEVTERPERIERPTRDPDAPNPPADRDPVRVDVPDSPPRSETAIIATSGRSAERAPAIDTAPPVWHARWNRFIGHGAGACLSEPAATSTPTLWAHGRAVAD